MHSIETDGYFFAKHRKNDAFSIHSKGDENKNVTILSDAINTMASSNEYFQQQQITLGEALNTTKVLNGPEGSISNVSMQSLDVLEWILRKLEKHTNSFSFQHTNLGSSMRLETEQFHATVHCKENSLTPLEYARSFGQTLNETNRRLVSLFYHPAI